MNTFAAAINGYNRAYTMMRPGGRVPLVAYEVETANNLLAQGLNELATQGARRPGVAELYKAKRIGELELAALEARFWDPGTLDEQYVAVHRMLLPSAIESAHRGARLLHKPGDVPLPRPVVRLPESITVNFRDAKGGIVFPPKRHLGVDFLRGETYATFGHKEARFLTYDAETAELRRMADELTKRPPAGGRPVPPEKVGRLGHDKVEVSVADADGWPTTWLVRETEVPAELKPIVDAARREHAAMRASKAAVDERYSGGNNGDFPFAFPIAFPINLG